MKDHREIAKEMKLFAFDEEVGTGLPLWLPNGAALIEEIEKYAKEIEFAAGYQRVKTPQLAREALYLRSGHVPLYKENMFPPMDVPVDGQDDGSGDATIPTERYYLKAMNCPHHHKLFGALPRSYKELPLRFAEYGTCYRYEESGSLMGLMRSRSLQMNDAHIYCTEEQFAREFQDVHEMCLHYLQQFGIDDYEVRFSTHAPELLGHKYVNKPELWKATEKMVRDALDSAGIDNYVEVPNEAAFYGPKIDILVKSVMGKEFTISTNQVDFVMPDRFELKYRDKNNELQTPLCIHRAPLGTHERFIAFLIEHYQGKFPFWLSPNQVRVIPVQANHFPQEDYARGIEKLLRARGIRADGDYLHEPLMARIARAEKEGVHTIMVVGREEVLNDTVAMRSRNVKLPGMSIYDAVKSLQVAANQREQ